MKKLKGFTLVELVITIAIVLILSVVSVPIYRQYTDKAKMAEGYALLGTILSAQKAYYSEYGYFIDDHQLECGSGKLISNSFPLGIDARGNKYFSLFYVDSSDSADNYLHVFSASALKPTELIKGNKSYLVLSYDITGGVRYREGQGNAAWTA